jgi:hypothetical protein
METTIDLHAPTSRVAEGPRLMVRGPALVLEYDVEDDDGRVAWHSVEFAEVLDFEFRSAAVCSKDNVVKSTLVRRRDQSERLEAAISKWELSVGWQAWNQERGGRSRFAEYSLFFDDVGALVVVASSCKVST